MHGVVCIDDATDYVCNIRHIDMWSMEYYEFFR